MRMDEAMEIINQENTGYFVHFERVGNGILISDYFPSPITGDRLIQSEEEAWELARKFAEKTGSRCVNVYVCYDDHTPVPNYREKMIENR